VRIEPRERLAFLACEGNDRLLVLDMCTMQVSRSFDVCGDPDGPAFDPALTAHYVASEAGIVSMFAVDSTAVKKVGEGRVGPNAHVVAIDGTTHRAYFPLKGVCGRPVLRIMEPLI
jgi:hypothetical protein